MKNYKYRIINFHPAILPMFPGLNAIDQAADSEKSVLLIGNTAHFVDEGIDTGKIIMQSVIPLDAFLFNKDYDIVLDIIIEMITKLIAIIENNRLQIINDRPFIEGADYTKYSIFPYITEDKQEEKV